MDEDAEQERGRLRLRWPTFRGSSVGWGIGAFFWLFSAVLNLVGVVQDGGTTAVGTLILAALVVLAVVCIMGTVATIRHPRPAPPATDM
jgi:hypothetical protein